MLKNSTENRVITLLRINSAQDAAEVVAKMQKCLFVQGDEIAAKRRNSLAAVVSFTAEQRKAPE